MTQSSKEDILKKWSPIIESMGVTGSKVDWMSQYVEMHSNNENNIQTTLESQTLFLDLVSVMPLGGGNTYDQLEDIKKDVKIENRDRIIESFIDDKEYKEMSIEDHPDYIKPKGPSGQLFHMDYIYGGSTISDTTI